MTAFDDLVADWPHRDAAAVLRLARIIGSRDRAYWIEHGRPRFVRELGEDGLEPDRIAAAVRLADQEWGEEIDLVRILEDLKRRDVSGGGV